MITSHPISCQSNADDISPWFAQIAKHTYVTLIEHEIYEISTIWHKQVYVF